MLIVAIPKSASTSLMRTLGDLHQMEARQDMSWLDNPVPQDCSYLHEIHSDVRELSDGVVEMFADSYRIFKQHIFPSSENLKKLDGLKKVVLLRDPKSICEAYLRGRKKKVHTLLPGFSDQLTDKEWMKLANEKGLIRDLEYFYNTWNSLRDNENVLIVQYKDLINKPDKVIGQIEEFWSLEHKSKNVKLAKERYSRRTGLAQAAYVFKWWVRNSISSFLEFFGIKVKVKKVLGKE